MNQIRNFAVFAVVIAILAIVLVPAKDARKTTKELTHSPARVNSTPEKVPEKPGSVVFFVLDASRSFHTMAMGSLYGKSIQHVADAARVLARELPGPQMQYVSLITNFSRKDDPLCRIVVGNQSPFHGGGKSLPESMESCKSKLSAFPPTSQSDIHGAITAAAQTMAAHPGSLVKAIVIFSDLDEDYTGNTVKPAPLDLADICVAAFYDDLREPALKNPAIIEQRASKWEVDLRESKARKVLVAPLRSFAPARLAELLAGCY